jgi:MtfA peptidase
VLNLIKRARTRYIIHRYGIKHDLWATVSGKLWLLQGMSSVEKAYLRELSSLFLYQKRIIGVDLQITETMRISVAAQACLPVLTLGIGLLNGFTDIIIYPGAFRVSRDEQDEYGIVHHNERILSGEAWTRGPVILSWDDIERDLQALHQGHNVIVHEIAHKLDMLNGQANGMPPLHVDMQTVQWTAALSTAYEQLHQRLEHHHRVCVNPYAATNPAEFFAVFSEYFFCSPDILHRNFADVYEQLRLYYRQDPLRRSLNGMPSSPNSTTREFFDADRHL